MDMDVLNMMFNSPPVVWSDWWSRMDKGETSVGNFWSWNYCRRLSTAPVRLEKKKTWNTAIYINPLT